MMGLISLDEVLASTGEDSPRAVTQLLLRGRGLKGFGDDVTASLEGLEVLSLSHNRFKSLSQFGGFINLVELNLNFNQVTSLSGLKAPLLQQLYLSNNRLTSVSDLLRFPRLHTACLFGNSLPDLTGVVAHMKQLARLTHLDLDGNPCAQEAGYKHHVVRALPRLSRLDGEEVQAIDRELAEEFHKRRRSQDQADGTTSSSCIRPSTAPSKLGNYARSGDTGQGGPSGAGGVGHFNPNTLTRLLASAPRGEVSLFQDRRLNDNPIVLGYLAEAALCSPLRMRGRRLPPPSPAGQCNEGSNLRPLQPSSPDDCLTPRAPTGRSGDTPRDNHTAAADPRVDSPESRSPLPSPLSPCPGAGSVQDSRVDCSDPHVTIRKLLKLVEYLQARKEEEEEEEEEQNEAGSRPGSSREGHKEDDVYARVRGLEAEVQRLEEEVTWLRAENGSVFLLKQESEALRAQIQALTGVRQERDRLLREKRDLQQTIRDLQCNQGRWGEEAGEGRPGREGLGSGETLLVVEDYEEEEDREIAALLKRNEESLRELRESMIQTKVEMDLHDYCSTEEERQELVTTSS